jgi:hypothetical protein
MAVKTCHLYVVVSNPASLNGIKVQQHTIHAAQLGMPEADQLHVEF